MGVSFYFVYLKKFYHNIKFIFTKDKNTQHNIKKDLDEIDYFLIDANCLIHPMCFKTIADNPNITNYDELEDKMMITITNYLQYIIEHVNPKKGVFIAVDGVCPAAKIKHQRSRRYKTAYDKILYDDIKKKYSKAIITSWSNSAITPGTLFMAKLHNYLSEWCKKIKINIDLIYSSYKIPGEGEHKLLQFIKDNNTNNKKFSYVIYGADADLIFLSLLANVKIYLMRENSEITKDSSMSVEELNYISIDILKDLIFDTFNQKYKSKKLGNIQLSKSNIINDYIFISYFLGNDFLPHLLALSIKHNGVDYLIDNYINTFHEINKNKQIPEYIIESNNINDNFLIYLLKLLSLQEEDILKSYANNRKKMYTKSTDKYEQEIFKIENLQFNIPDPVKIGHDTFEEYRIRYYKHYWNIDENEIEKFSKKLVKEFLYGLKWTTLYYFDECSSWNWFYPFDQPPFLADIYKYIEKYPLSKIKFKLGKPVCPFVQLLLVLPIQSHYLLPDKLKNNIKNMKEIIYLYPESFELDLLNKYKYWMALPKLPPMNIKLIKEFYNKYKKKLSTEDKKCNTLEKLPYIKN